jgi:hypothetical protein
LSTIYPVAQVVEAAQSIARQISTEIAFTTKWRQTPQAERIPETSPGTVTAEAKRWVAKAELQVAKGAIEACESSSPQVFAQIAYLH